MSETIYLPRTPDAPPDPAPYLMTEDEVIRILRLSNKFPADTIRRYRELGWLTAVKISNRIRYALPDVLALIERSKKETPV